MLYDGFISYSHAREAAVARAIQSALHRFARPWYRLRALRIFRDVTNLSANPGLWSAIEKALSEARFFLLLASPQSAASPWVQREVEWWLRHRQADHLLLVLVGGDIRWDNQAGDFDWAATTVLPRGLAGAFREEPLYLDFRDAGPADELSLANPVFSDRVASLAATLHGRPKDEMIGEDVRQHRRAMRAAWTAAAALAVLAMTAATAAFVAVQQRNVAVEQRQVAEERRRLAEAREIVVRGELLRGDRPELHPAGLLLAAEGLRRLAAAGAPTWEADQALRRSLALTPELLAEFQLEEPAVSFAFSPDGSRLAAGFRRGVVQVWTVGTDAPTLDYSHGDRAASIAFSPDGTRLASASWDGVAALVDVGKGSILGRFQHAAAVWALAFSPDGRRLVTAGAEGMAHVWDLRSGREEAKLPHGATIAGVSMSGDGRFIVLQGADGVASLFDARTMKRTGQIGHPQQQLEAAVFSADGRRLATRSLDHTFLLDTEAEKQLARILERPSAETWVEGVPWSADAIAFSPDSRWLYTAHRDRSARIVDAATGAEVRTIPHDQPVRGVASSADGKLLATRAGSVVRLWDAGSGVETGRLNHEGIVTHMAFSQAGGLIATVAGAQIRLWRDNTGNPRLALPHTRGVWERLYSRDGRWLISQDPPQVVSVWAADSGQRVTQLRHPDLIRNARFSDDGNQLATACNDSNVRVWELPSGRLLAQLQTPRLPLPLAFSHGGTLLATVAGGDRPDEPGTLLVWDWQSDHRILTRSTAKESRQVAFSPDDRRLVYADAQPSLQLVSLGGSGKTAVLEGYTSGGEPFSADGRSLIAWRGSTAALIDTATGKLIRSIDFDQEVRLAEIAPQSGTVAVIVEDKSVRLWSGGSNDRVIITLAHELPVNSVRFSPDGRWLATGSGHPITGRGEARVWSVPAGELTLLQPQERGVWIVDFSADGAQLATLARDLPLRIWIASRDGLLHEAGRRATRNLTHAEWRQFLPGEPYPLLCDQKPVHASVGEAAANLLLDGDEAGGLHLCERISLLGAQTSSTAALPPRAEAARVLLARSVALARAGSVPRALQGLRLAQDMDGEVNIPAGTWNLVAWSGATRGHARDILFAAERALDLEPDNINYRDTRGVARALTGDVTGAIEDFKAFVAGAQDYPAKMVEQRHLWLADLVLGRNPFSDEVLRALRAE